MIAPTDNPAWSTDLLYGDHFVFGSSGLGAPGGYPYVQVPATNVFGIPMGITFFGTAFSEPKLIALASGFEAVTHERARNLPKFTPTIPDDHIAGEPLNVPRGKNQKLRNPRDGVRITCRVTQRGVIARNGAPLGRRFLELQAACRLRRWAPRAGSYGRRSGAPR